MFCGIGLILLVTSVLNATCEPLVNIESQDVPTRNEIKHNDEFDNCIASQQQNSKDEATDVRIYDLCHGKVRLNDVEYACRHDIYVILKWKLDYDGLDHFNFDNITYFVEKWSTNATKDNNRWTESGWSKSKKFQINGLEKKTNYKFRVTPYLNKIKLGLSSESEFITTLLGNETPKEIRNIHVKAFYENSGSVNALLSWDPLEDLVCDVRIVYFHQGGSMGMIPGYIEVKAENSREIKRLDYSSSYKVQMHSKINRAESNVIQFTIDTPSCAKLNNYSSSKCVPDPPEILNVEDDCTKFKIKWKAPLALPDYYSVLFRYDDVQKHFFVTGDKTEIEFITENLRARQTYLIFLTANSTAGQSKPSVYHNFSQCPRIETDLRLFNAAKLKKYTKETRIPANLKLEGDCKPEIKWDKPSANVTHFEISVSSSNLKQNFNISGNDTNIKLDKLEDGQFWINMTAFDSEIILGQNSITANITCITQLSQWKNIIRGVSGITVNTPSKGEIIMLIVIAITVPTVIVVVTIWRVFFCKLLQKDVDMMQPEDSFRRDVNSKKIDATDLNGSMIDSKEALEKVIYDEYEVRRDNVRLCQVLGEGEFGVVHKAVLIEGGTHLKYVAVKTLRNKESVEEKRQLEKEMEVMKSVGKHMNIVSLLGCCTEDMMLIVEYCSLGDLRRFLRKTWRIKSYAEEAISEKSNRDLLERKAFSNILYEQSAAEKRYLNLSMMDLLSFSRQIALGMAYLAENRVVHRDVAARNVLLADDMTAKIADFGLSRDVYERNIYMKRSTDRLPLRWMALESLQYQVFSTKSDVWSYGILLWEIMTLGGCPYPSLQTSEVYKLLQEGYRMERPKPCTPELYEIMLSCWVANPKYRPTFAQLVLKVEGIMKSESNRSYLDLSTCDYKNHLDEGYDIK